MQAKKRDGGGLTAAKVRTAGPGKYHDGNGTGLFLRVDPSGARFWIQRITIHGKRREIGLGSFPMISLADARQAAMENKRLAYNGGDPLASRRNARQTLTFHQAVEQYLAAKLDEFRNEKHKKQWRSTLDRYAMPVIGDMPVQAVEVADLLRVLHPIWTVKTETASRLRGRIENVLSWATVSGHRSGPNPARWRGNLSELLPKPTKVAKTGNHPALALADAPCWWEKLSQRDGIAARALEFTALTAARSGEVRRATWDEIDFGTPVTLATSATNAPLATWTISASRMKGGRPHRVPLTRDAVAILENLPRMDGSP